MVELTRREKVNLLKAEIEAYYSVCSTGGSLHIVLDDGNWRRDDLSFCLNRAIADGDHFGVAIATALLELPDECLKAAAAADYMPHCAALDLWISMAESAED